MPVERTKKKEKRGGAKEGGGNQQQNSLQAPFQPQRESTKITRQQQLETPKQHQSTPTDQRPERGQRQQRRYLRCANHKAFLVDRERLDLDRELLDDVDHIKGQPRHGCTRSPLLRPPPCSRCPFLASRRVARLTGANRCCNLAGAGHLKKFREPGPLSIVAGSGSLHGKNRD